MRYKNPRLPHLTLRTVKLLLFVIKYLDEYRMRENLTLNIEVNTMSATCRLTLYLILAVSQTKLHARYWLTVIQLQYRLPIQYSSCKRWDRNSNRPCKLLWELIVLPHSQTPYLL